jgi:hypothetical protein
LFLDALIKAVERVGGKVSTEWGYKAEKTSVSFAGEVVATIRLREKHTQTRPGGDLIPTGRIMLDSGSSTYGPVYCIDTEEGKRIEDAINDLIIRWVKEAGKARIARREEEEECQREAEEERIRREREAERRAEQSRVDRLIADADAWQKSQTLRAYIQAVEERAIREHGRIEEGSEPDCWLKWAHRQADRLDPLTPSPPSIIDETP